MNINRELDNSEDGKYRRELSRKVSKTVECLADLKASLEDVEKLKMSSSSEKLVESEIKNKTVKDLQKFLKEEELSETQLKKILEWEKDSKNRKTALKKIKREIRKNKPSNVKKRILDNVQELEKEIKKLEVYQKENSVGSKSDQKSISKNQEVNRNSNPHKEKQSIQSLLDITEKVAKDLDSGKLDRKDVESIKKGIKAFESRDYESAYRRFREVTPNEKKTTEEKLNRMEEMVTDIQKREEELQKDQERNISNGLEMSFEGEERSDREKNIEELSKKGVNEDRLRRKSNSDLEKIRKSSNSMKQKEDIFSNIGNKDREKSKVGSEKDTGEIRENIEELESLLEDESRENDLFSRIRE